MGKKRGRPNKDVTKDTTIQFRVTEEELAAFEEACHKIGKNRSSVLRNIVNYFSYLNGDDHDE